MEPNVELTKSQQEFDALLEEYNRCKLAFESLPKAKIEKGKQFDIPGYQRSEAARVRMDIALANIVRLRQGEVDFLQVDKEGSVILMTYNPFGKYLDSLEDMEYTYVDVMDKKTKAYTKAANDCISWRMKIMKGDINNLFNFKLVKWFTEKKVQGDVDDFCKDVALIIRYYPHEDMKTNEDYLVAFFEWYVDLETDEIMRMSVYDGIMVELKKCFFENVRKEFEKDNTLENEIRCFSPVMKIQDCSKKCHEKFIRLRIGSEKKKSFLDGIRARGLEKKTAIESRFKPATQKPKRPRPTDDGEESVAEPPEKKFKDEVLDDNEEGYLFKQFLSKRLKHYLSNPHT